MKTLYLYRQIGPIKWHELNHQKGKLDRWINVKREQQRIVNKRQQQKFSIQLTDVYFVCYMKKEKEGMKREEEKEQTSFIINKKRGEYEMAWQVGEKGAKQRLLTLLLVVVADDDKVVGQPGHLGVFVELSRGGGGAQHPTFCI